MRVTLALVADAANVSREGKLNILGVFDTIYTRQFPTTHPQMQVVVRFEADPTEVGGERQVEIRVVDPDGDAVLRVPGTLTVRAAVRGDRAQIDRIVALTGVTFPGPGRYALTIVVDGATAATVALYVEELGTAH